MRKKHRQQREKGLQITAGQQMSAGSLLDTCPGAPHLWTISKSMGMKLAHLHRQFARHVPRCHHNDVDVDVDDASFIIVLLTFIFRMRPPSRQQVCKQNPTQLPNHADMRQRLHELLGSRSGNGDETSTAAKRNSESRWRRKSAVTEGLPPAMGIWENTSLRTRITSAKGKLGL